MNRTEALDAAKRGIQDKEVVLPRRSYLLEVFAEHLAADARQLVEDKETGAKTYRYVRTGTNHYSLAFTYDWLASENERRASSWETMMTFGDTITGGLLRDSDGVPPFLGLPPGYQW